MEFKARDIESELWKKVYEPETFITRDEVLMALRNEFLHDQHSHFIVTGEGTYDDTRVFNYGIVPDRINRLEEAYNEGKTIVVKEMENWNPEIQKRCDAYPRYCDVHMYVSPAGATGFGWHTDDKDVYVHMQFGKKNFEVEEPNGKISKYLLEAGDVLFIPYGSRHRAFAGESSSVHLGFGVWPENLCTRDEYENFDMEIDIKL